MENSGGDTIAAIATGAGGGIGIVRVSGPDALAVAGRIFRGRGGAPLESAAPLTLILGAVVHPMSGARIDEAFAVRMREGHSYTGEPVVEFQCHGGRATLQAVLRAALGAGARPAAPGEFTKRAFLSGRIDLSQAEAVAELIAAQSVAARVEALSRLRGGLAQTVRSLAEPLLEQVATVEAILDHGDEDLAESGPDGTVIETLARDLRGLVAQGEHRDSRQHGTRVVIAGRTNTGKSSIFNMLCCRSRSIVSHLPGTTRDYVEESLSIEGTFLTLVDTAGMRETMDPVEADGVRRSRRQMLDADLLILTIDGSQPLCPDDLRLIEEFRGRSPLVLLTKADLPLKIDRRQLQDRCAGLPILPLSIHDGRGCPELARELAGRCRERICDSEAAAPNLRHREALREAAMSLEKAAGLISLGKAPLDQVALELRRAVASLGEITGESATEEILDRIFSRFCVGK